MLNFEYHTPTKVVFGKAAESKTGSLIKEQGCRKVLVHYGSGSVVRSGLLDRVYASLDAEGIPYVSLGAWFQTPVSPKYARESHCAGGKESTLSWQ